MKKENKRNRLWRGCFIVTGGVIALWLGFSLSVLPEHDFSSSEAGKTVRVLIVTGMDHPAHNWRSTTEAVQEVLSKEDRIILDVLEDPYALDSFDLSTYDVLFLHFNNWERPDPGQEAQYRLQKFVSEGGGLVLLHFACGAFGDWEGFEDLAGKVWDKTHTHDPYGEFYVEILSSDHPVTSGLESYFTEDELYIGVAGDRPVKVLAQARSVVTGKLHPLVFVHEYGKGHVFNMVLGHDAPAIRMENTAEMLRRGVVWSARPETSD